MDVSRYDQFGLGYQQFSNNHCIGCDVWQVLLDIKSYIGRIQRRCAFQHDVCSGQYGNNEHSYCAAGL